MPRYRKYWRRCNEPDIIGLNVGGKIYQTTSATLTRYSNSLFHGLLDGSVLSGRDVEGNYVITRDGEIFRHVLNFLRYGKIVLPEDFGDFHLLEREADFFSLEKLKEALKDTKRDEVGLNVGGKIYRISQNTLKSCPYLQNMLTVEQSAVLDAHGNYLIDQDGQIFRYVLNFLKSGELVLPEGFNEFDLLEHEAKFFELEDLQEMVKRKRAPMVRYIIGAYAFFLRREDVQRESHSIFAEKLSSPPVDRNYMMNSQNTGYTNNVIHYIEHGGIFKDLICYSIERLIEEAKSLGLCQDLMKLHVESIKALQALDREDEHLYLYVIHDNRPDAIRLNERCIAYTNKSLSLICSKNGGQRIRDFFCNGKVNQITVGTKQMFVGKVDLGQIKPRDRLINRTTFKDFDSYFSTGMSSQVDEIDGSFVALKVTISLN